MRGTLTAGKLVRPPMVIFDIKMCLQPGLCPDPDGRAYSTLPDPHTALWRGEANAGNENGG